MMQPVKHLLSILSNIEEPLREHLSFSLGTAPPAFSILINLFVCQHGLVYRVPIDLCILFVRESTIEHQFEYSLRLGVVFWTAGRDLSVPIERESHRIKLRTHLRNVTLGPSAWCNTPIDCRIFCW